MTTAITEGTRSYVAGGSINAYKAVRLSSTEDNTVHHNTSATTPTAGITLFSGSDGDVVTVVLGGTAKGVANAQLTKGALVKADNGGGLRTTTTAGNSVVGTVINSTTQTVTESGTELVEIDLSNRNSRY